MKTTTLLNRALFATALIAVSTVAFANGGGSGPRGAHNAPYPYADSRSNLPSAQVVSIKPAIAQAGAQMQQKTHAEVHQELLDAEKSGEFARIKVAYKGH
ncbi:hypothetical protein [Burkholderia sp. L27(2015)]|uniref:hypothetical protein n=1 Tax=Burkholderia sp. L27(2015) TaxID=1641858 RepID=UPI00131EAB39|nr:hypothetical protein [Burkholderia sp. L27(2015)]